MNYFKKILISAFICIVFLFPQTAQAGTASNVADKAINYTAKTVYYVTKYSLKAGWFVIKKTAKGIKVITQHTFKATKDAFNSGSKTKPINNIMKLITLFHHRL